MFVNLKTAGFRVDTNELNRSNIQTIYMKFQMKIHFDAEHLKTSNVSKNCLF